jgi:hypothetical protein
LRDRWYDISEREYYKLHLECISTHERHLRGLARKSKEHAFLHHSLLHEHGHKLRA